MALQRAVYRRRDAAHTVLHQVIAEHLEAFLRAVAEAGPIDGGGLSGLACRSPGPARSTREEAADVHCGSGFWGGQRPSLAHYVTGMGPMRSDRCRKSFVLPILTTRAMYDLDLLR